MKALLEKLQIKDVNIGSCSGPNDWYEDPQSEKIISYDPATGNPIATVLQATEKTYDDVMTQAVNAFQSWRMLPAPKRGLVVRDLGDALREYCEPLGELVSLEMGKIRAEGIGEVQEMIDKLKKG